MSRYVLNLPPLTLINTQEAIEEMRSRLLLESAVAVDTESNSLYAYTERVCLIQFSVPGEDYLVDPFAVEDLSSLRAVFADRGVEKVFHAAEYDVRVLRRDYQFEFVNLFDTMIASRIVGWPRYGLGSLLKERFGVLTNKRMQRTDWGKRPLSTEQLEYARLDTHFLLSLRDTLLDELQAQNRLAEARSAFSRVAKSQWNGRQFDPDGFWRIKKVRDLDEVGRAVLRALYLYRDERAQALDRPPFKVLTDGVLVALSQRRPSSPTELGRIKGIPRRLPSRERRRLLSVIERGMQDPVPKRPARKHDRPDEETSDRYEALREWRTNRAKDRGVEADVVLSNRVLHILARHDPTSMAELDALGVLNEWECGEYGREIVSALRRHRRFAAR
jgi:ribonuclease D